MVLEFLLEGLFRQIRQIQRKCLLAFTVFQVPTTQNFKQSNIFWVTFSASLQIKM